MITIRLAQPEDAADLQTIYYKTWLATYPNAKHGITVDDVHDHYKDAYNPERIKLRQERIKNLDQNKFHYLVAIDDKTQKPVGLCYLIKEEQLNRVQALYILPEYQRQGIGTLFWQEILKFFTEPRDIVLDTVIFNEPAIAFYKKLGFVDTGRRLKNERFKMKSGAILEELELVFKKTNEN